MEFTLQAFQTSKAGSRPEECEDAFRWNLEKRIYAIADGATDSAFQRLWANLLVDGFVKAPPTKISTLQSLREWFGGWLLEQQGRWNDGIKWDKLPWHGLNKAKQTGGLATFLGINFSAKSNHWYAIAIGDCNLFIFQKETGRISTLYPIHSSKDFGSNPFALSSIDPNIEKQFENVRFAGGFVNAGDILVMATDAVAAWCLTSYESSENILYRLLTLNTYADFDNMVDSLRSSGEMKDDDSSLVIIEVTETEAAGADLAES